MKKFQKHIPHSAFILFAILLSLFVIPIVSAHDRAEFEGYVLIIGWENEPVIVGERNALELEVTKDEEPIEGLESTLNLTIFYAGQTFTANLNPTNEPGIYTSEIFPTVRGQYEAMISGTIEETTIDITMEPEEVTPASRLQFPETLPDTRELEQSIEALTAEVQTARTLAIAGLIVGVIGLAVGAFGLMKGRS